ncbi:cytochrome P450 4d1-like [Culicoides brevitarsis]|uniref:cytochrome P450 4d1-like n=1 Tax=Culicoides brevitarsis TaxID=469753 RepID=UPI00307CC399
MEGNGGKVVWDKNSKRKILKSEVIPGPHPIPILGNGHEFHKIGSEAILQKFLEYRKLYGPIFRFYIGSKMWISVAEPEILEVILIFFLNFGHDYRFLVPWLGTGLVTGNGQKWFSRRKALTSAFHFQILDGFVDVMDRQATVLAEKLKQMPENEGFDITKPVSLYALDVICETAMGTKLNAQNDADSEYVKAVIELSSILYQRLFSASQRFDLIFKCTRAGRRHDELVKFLHDFAINVIRARRKQLFGDVNANQIDATDDFGIKKRMALLDLLLKTKINGIPLTDDDIREEVDSFMFAGHDTTTSALSFLCYNLARHPAIQAKVYDEICGLVLDSGKIKIKQFSLKLFPRQLNELKYLDLVIKESLRLHPPVPFVARKCSEDMIFGGKIFPKGSDISLAFYLLSRDERFFKDPEKFLPERFDLNENPEKLHPFAFTPFSAGPRNCIGQKFALYEIKTAIVKILQNFELSLADDSFQPIIEGELVLKSQNGIQLKVTQRH